MKRWLSACAAGLILAGLLASCAGPRNGTPPPTPSDGFSVAVSFDDPDGDGKLAVTRGNAAGAAVTVTVEFGSNYPDLVRIERNTPTTGVSVLHGGFDLELIKPALSASGSLELVVVATADAQTLNPFVEIIVQGVDEDGRTRDRPRVQKTVSLILD